MEEKGALFSLELTAEQGKHNFLDSTPNLLFSFLKLPLYSSYIRPQIYLCINVPIIKK